MLAAAITDGHMPEEEEERAKHNELVSHLKKVASHVAVS